MKSYAIWILRVVGLVATIMMVVSFAMPWWIGKFSQITGIWIYGWGLRHNLVQLAGNLAKDVTPLYKIVLAWVYIGISAALLLFSIFIKRKIAALIQGVIGIGYIVYTLFAMYVVIANRLKEFSIVLQGKSIPKGAIVSGIIVQSAIQPGFYLALASGACITLLAIMSFVSMEKQKYCSICKR